MRKPKRQFEKYNVSAEEWEIVSKEAEAAKSILESSQYKFFREYLGEAKQSIVEYFVRNKIKKVEEHFWSDAIKKIMKVLHITKEEQENELSGQFKFIEQLESDLHFIAYTRPAEYRKAEEAGRIKLNLQKDERGT
jgi:hypothetical protein